MVEDTKKIRRDLSSKPLKEIIDELNNLIKRVTDESYKATRTILLLKPEKSVTAERVYEELSSLLANLKQDLRLEKSEIMHKLDIMISNMVKLKVLLKKSFESPNPIVKKIISMMNSELIKNLKNIPNTKRVKKLSYTQFKITSFTNKKD
ncbi:MAG: hypothetical protein QW193_04225 [Nitrososphaerales archaeon]